MTTITRNTTVTTEITNEEIVQFMLGNGSPSIIGGTYLTDWIEEGDCDGATLGEIMAEWIE